MPNYAVRPFQTASRAQLNLALEQARRARQYRSGRGFFHKSPAGASEQPRAGGHWAILTDPPVVAGDGYGHQEVTDDGAGAVVTLSNGIGGGPADTRGAYVLGGGTVSVGDVVYLVPSATTPAWLIVAGGGGSSDASRLFRISPWDATNACVTDSLGSPFCFHSAQETYAVAATGWVEVGDPVWWITAYTYGICPYPPGVPNVAVVGMSGNARHRAWTRGERYNPKFGGVFVGERQVWYSDAYASVWLVDCSGSKPFGTVGE